MSESKWPCGSTVVDRGDDDERFLVVQSDPVLLVPLEADGSVAQDGLRGPGVTPLYRLDQLVEPVLEASAEHRDHLVAERDAWRAEAERLQVEVEAIDRRSVPTPEPTPPSFTLRGRIRYTDPGLPANSASRLGEGLSWEVDEVSDGE